MGKSSGNLSISLLLKSSECVLNVAEALKMPCSDSPLEVAAMLFIAHMVSMVATCWAPLGAVDSD